MDYLNVYSHEQISNRLIIFTEGYSMVHRFTIGCVVGDEKILIIDAGLGADDGLRKYIEGVVGTGKPMLCACTHGHPDHVGSAMLFDEAYLNHRDYDRLGSFALVKEQRLTDLDAFCLFNKEVNRYCKLHALDNAGTQFKDMDDGDVFDLGGVKIECIAVPGHSAGSIAFYNREENYVFTGDIINTDTHLKKMNREGFVALKKTYRRFLTKVDKDARVYPAHLPLTMDMQIVHNLMACIDDLLAGKTQGDPPGETIFTERNNNPDLRMHFVNNTCIVYNRTLL